jgi:hypothetical protein
MCSEIAGSTFFRSLVTYLPKASQLTVTAETISKSRERINVHYLTRNSRTCNQELKQKNAKFFLRAIKHNAMKTDF